MKNADKPAHPVNKDHIDGRDYKGLTKREYFAAMAMQGIISGVYSSKEAYASFQQSAGKSNYSVVSFAAEQANIFADELLKQLETK